MQPNESGVKPWQWVVTVLVIIVLIGLGIYFWGGSPSTSTDTTDTTNPVVNQQNGELNRIIVTDQFPGNIVYITTVQLAQPGFVAIYADNAGKPGTFIGSQYFDKGIGPGKVTLTQSTIDGSTYYAVLVADDGDKIFDASKDTTVKDSKGMVIMKSFKATSDIQESKG